MTALPEWVSRCENTICEDDYDHLWQALAIAWEALEWYPKYFGDNTTLQSRMAKEAMRRIAELGENNE